MNARVKSWAVAVEAPDDTVRRRWRSLRAAESLRFSSRDFRGRFGRAIALVLKLLLQQRAIVGRRLTALRFLRLQPVAFGSQPASAAVCRVSTCLSSLPRSESLSSRSFLSFASSSWLPFA